MSDLHTCAIHNRDWYYDCFVCDAIQTAEKLAEREFLRVLLKIEKEQERVSNEKE
jgi:7,8-dihydro-6-hydroxymethylpterin-pyrophosphokinase